VLACSFKYPGQSGKRILINNLKGYLVVAVGLRKATNLAQHRIRTKGCGKALINGNIAEAATSCQKTDGALIVPSQRGGIGYLDALHPGCMRTPYLLHNLGKGNGEWRESVFLKAVQIVPPGTAEKSCSPGLLWIVHYSAVFPEEDDSRGILPIVSIQITEKQNDLLSRTMERTGEAAGKPVKAMSVAAPIFFTLKINIRLRSGEDSESPLVLEFFCLGKKVFPPTEGRKAYNGLLLPEKINDSFLEKGFIVIVGQREDNAIVRGVFLNNGRSYLGTKQAVGLAGTIAGDNDHPFLFTA
jgi:hypothetical protein